MTSADKHQPNNCQIGDSRSTCASSTLRIKVPHVHPNQKFQSNSRPEFFEARVFDLRRIVACAARALARALVSDRLSFARVSGIAGSDRRGEQEKGNGIGPKLSA